MTDKQDLIREIHEYVAAHGGENTATHLLVQAASAIQTQAAELEAVGAGGVQSLSQKKATPASVDKAQSAINSGAGGVQALSAAPAGAPTADVQAKIASNTWDHFGDILPTLKAISRGDWYWGANSRCKYIEIRIDTRDGGCILYDRERVRISPEQFAHQSHHVGKMQPWPAANQVAALPTPPAEQQAAPKAAPAWEHHARKLTRWLHCMSHNDSYFGEPAGLVKQVTGELNRLIGAAPQQEAQDSVSPRHPVVMQWRDNAIEACAKIADAYGHEHAAQDMRAMLTAPQQEAQEPALFVSAKQLADLVDPSHATGGSYLPARKTSAGLFTQPLYTAPQPAPARLSDDVVQKTWALIDELEKLRSVNHEEEDWGTLNKRDSELRAALTHKEKP